MQIFRIFIVEDDPWYGELIEYHLAYKPDHEIHRFATGTECLNNLDREPDLISIDYSLPDMNGVELLKGIRAYNKEVPVIVISAQEDVSTAVTLLKKGATDYFFKNDNTKELLWKAVNRIKENLFLKYEVEQLKVELSEKFRMDKVVKGNSVAMHTAFAQLEKAAATNVNVCIQGETGTGKEVAAKAIHYNSDRFKGPLVVMNLAIMQRGAVSRELFGYEKGAFPEAFVPKPGKLEEANGGTLFIDDIDALDLGAQEMLVRAIENRYVVRLGDQRQVKLDVRYIFATNKNLVEEVRRGNFREDLFYRVMGLPVELPPLRQRADDILLLADHFLHGYCHSARLEPKAFSKDAQQKLLHYFYPGNVRELKAVVEFSAIMCETPVIGEGDIFFANLPHEDFFYSDEKTLREYTTDIIQHYLKKYENNVVKVAAKLNIGKSTIYKLMQGGAGAEAGGSLPQ